MNLHFESDINPPYAAVFAPLGLMAWSRTSCAQLFRSVVEVSQLSLDCLPGRSAHHCCCHVQVAVCSCCVDSPGSALWEADGFKVSAYKAAWPCSTQTHEHTTHTHAELMTQEPEYRRIHLYMHACSKDPLTDENLTQTL
jgi:hypothetical protein